MSEPPNPNPNPNPTATGLLTKVGSDLDAACGAVGAAVASDVRGEYTRSAPPFATAVGTEQKQRCRFHD